MRRELAVIYVMLMCLGMGSMHVEGVTTLSLWAAGLPGSFNQWIVDDFPRIVQKAYPDIALEVTVIPGRQNLEDKRMVAAVAGVGPDIFHESGNFGLQAAHNGSALALDKYVAQWPEYKDIIKMINWQYKGRVYGIPYAVNMTGVGFWEDMLQEGGVALFTDWDGLLRAAKKLTIYGTDGRLERAGLSLWDPYDIWGGLYPFTVFMEQLGGSLFSEDFRLPTFNNDIGRQALAYVSELHEVAMPSGTPPASSFTARGSAMHFWFSNWHTPAISETYGEDANRLRLVKVPGPQGASNAVGITQSWGWMISPNSKHPDLAFEVIRFFLEPEVQGAFLNAFTPGGLLSPRRSFRYPATWPFVADAVRMSAPPLVNEWGPLHPFFSDVIRVAPGPLYEGVVGKRSIASALEETDRLLRVMLTEKAFP